jgi:glyoxylate reductase
LIPPRVFATCDIGAEALRRLVDHGYELEVYPGPEAPPESLIREKVASGVVALITTLRDRISDAVLAAGRGTLRVVGQYAVGFDNIDREAANRYRIPFTFTPDVLTDATAEFALFMMGDVARKLYLSERLVREGRWTGWHPYLPFLGNEVSGATVSVIGAGRIGRAFALKCAGLDMDVVCCSRAENPDFAMRIQQMMDLKFQTGLSARRATFRWAGLDSSLQQADFVSLHLPSTAETRQLIRADTLALMRPTAYLINTSRGAIIDENSLCRALRQGVIAGAALDVYENEPLPANSPLRAPDLEDRLRLYHHLASGAKRTRLSPDPNLGMAGRCVQAVLDVLEGHYGGNPARMPFVVNKEAFL